MRVPKFEKIVDEFCRFQELVNLLTVVCIDVKDSVCESFKKGREARGLFAIVFKHLFSNLAGFSSSLLNTLLAKFFFSSRGC